MDKAELDRKHAAKLAARHLGKTEVKTASAPMLVLSSADPDTVEGRHALKLARRVEAARIAKAKVEAKAEAEKADQDDDKKAKKPAKGDK